MSTSFNYLGVSLFQLQITIFRITDQQATLTFQIRFYLFPV